MVIDYTPLRDKMLISFVDTNSQISIRELTLDDGYYEYVDCSEYDVNRIPELRSFKDSYVKREKSKSFSHHNINEFFFMDMPRKYPEIYEKINNVQTPNPFSVDIEVLPTDEHGYSSQKEALNPVTSISITDRFLNSIVFIVKDEKHFELTDYDKSYVDGLLQEQLKDYYHNYDFKYDVRFFNTEAEMLSVFLETINKYFHLSIGWNILEYDWQYITNRCARLGIDIKKASPIGRLTRHTIVVNEETKIELTIPSHRLIICYMNLFKESLIYNNLGSYSLNAISELILNLQKVEYPGNLRTLYNDDFFRFIAYGIVDTILPMLIHKATNLLQTDFFQSYYTGIPYARLSQNAISEALIYKELRSDNIFLLKSEKNSTEHRDYKGGYVKTPTKKIIRAGIGEDYGALYPNGMLTMGLSPDAKIDKIVVDDDGFPKTEIEERKWATYKKMGYCLSPNGNIYDMSKDFLYTRIEKKVLNQRKVFSAHAEDIYLNIIPKIEQELKNRKEHAK